MHEAKYLGPYRVEDCLGSGGMGVVYKAWDERLGRHVAIKQVKAGREGSPRHRERLRREARAVAELRHPALVQVYDIISDDDSDSIVMELVAGETLAEQVKRAPLPPGRALRILRGIAEGLAEAHAKGIVHRDLKTDNVILTASDQPRILDFGLAKSVERDDPETALTGEGQVLGTVRAMSPEQAMGEAVGSRSDLFSFGILAYETLTGRTPFKGAHTIDTLRRISYEPHRPVRELSGEVPRALSALIDVLLAKDPAERPESAADVVTALEAIEHSESVGAGLASGSGRMPASVEALVSKQLRRKGRGRGVAIGAGVAIGVAVFLAAAWFVRGLMVPERVHVLVPVTVLAAEEPSGQQSLAASGAHMALLSSLVALEGVVPLDGSSLPPGVESDEENARSLAADELLLSTLECPGRECQVGLKRIRVADGHVLETTRFLTPLDEPQVLAGAVAVNVARLYPVQQQREGTPRLEVGPEDYEAYVRLKSSQGSHDRTVMQDLRELEAILERSPRFFDALLEATERLRYLYLDTRDADYLEKAELYLERAAELAPLDLRVYWTRFNLRMARGRLDEAEQALADLERLDPGNVRVLTKRAELLEQRGELDQALALQRKASQRRPSWKILYNLAHMEHAHGMVDEARTHINQILQLSPGNRYALGKLGELELLHGDLEEAERIYVSLVEAAAEPGDLNNLGVARLLLRRYAAAAEVLRQALEMAPDDTDLLLGLADCEHLLGHEERARELYTRVLELVPSDESQPDRLLVKAQAHAHLDQPRQAVAATQEALRLASDSPEVSLLAALVYSQVGEHSSALVNATRAVKMGVNTRWFTFPGYEPLFEDPEFRALIEADGRPSDR